MKKWLLVLVLLLLIMLVIPALAIKAAPPANTGTILMSISVIAGDYFEILSHQPTWVTNPATTIYGGYIYVE